jgi:hypothetical protein
VILYGYRTLLQSHSLPLTCNFALLLINHQVSSFETGGSSVQWEGPGDIDADHVAPKYCQEL